MRLYILLSLLFILYACSLVSTECRYDIECYEVFTSEDSDNDTLVLTSAIGHVFYADTSEYAPASYQDALEGILTNRNSSSTINAAVTSSLDSSNGVLTLGDVTESRAIFVVCDTKNQILGYRQYAVGEGIPVIETYITFYPENFSNNPDTTFTISNWIFKK